MLDLISAFLPLHLWCMICLGKMFAGNPRFVVAKLFDQGPQQTQDLHTKNITSHDAFGTFQFTCTVRLQVTLFVVIFCAKNMLQRPNEPSCAEILPGYQFERDDRSWKDPMISSLFHLFFWTEQIATDCYRPPKEVSTKSKPGGSQQRLNNPGGLVAIKYAFHRDVAVKTRDTYTQITFKGILLERVENS